MLIDFFHLQAVVPSSAVHAVKELFVPSTRVASVKAEAEALPALDITKVFTQLRQDIRYINTVNEALERGSQYPINYFEKYPISLK